MNGTLAFSPKYINIARFCQEYTEILRELIPNLKTELDMPEECIVLADPVLLQQLLLNLTSNSLLHGKTDSISLRLIDGGKNLILAFSDSGCGIESDRLGTVFERYRVRKELTDVRVGAGLGLTVVRGIAEKHGGTLLLESRENQGTAIRVSLQKNSDGAKLYDTDKGSINMKEIITGLAECLPTEYFTEKYLD